MKKVLWFDCETIGLDPVKNDPIQLAGLIEVDGEMVEEFNFKFQPISWENINQEALDVHKMTIDEIKTFMLPNAAHALFIDVLGRHCEKFNRADKFYPAGYNVKVDIDFLAQWFHKLGDNYLGSWINWRALDPLPLLAFMDFQDKIVLPNYKLETVASALNVELIAHDALSDVRATREIYRQITDNILIAKID
jgi:DNA polymerase III subunit epsilon